MGDSIRKRTGEQHTRETFWNIWACELLSFIQLSYNSDMHKVRNILDVRALGALEANSSTTAEISIRAESGNVLMLDLTQKARKDARTLKTITILTLIYLPVSFVSVRELFIYHTFRNHTLAC